MSQGHSDEHSAGLTPAEQEFIAALRRVEAAPFALDAVDLAFRAGRERGRVEGSGRARVWRSVACAASLAMVVVLGAALFRPGPTAGLPDGGGSETRLASAGAPKAMAPVGGVGRTSAAMPFIPTAGSSRRVQIGPGSAIDRLLSMGVLP
ncbi:MAG: hypothetical protein ACOYN0_05500 [Phycisphaerales bacterium]